ncbi:raffinose synthase or seed inhibition protein [Medicago truncatula]|uniref:Raffinose synthase or seed inhibition protein n=1 Tax=Medicago truncatula TaxID=3880 RepID=G7J5K2_MEDTR|nr:raffinose synthase or seed inhibition protein [Medicago truncatula]
MSLTKARELGNLKISPYPYTIGYANGHEEETISILINFTINIRGLDYCLDIVNAGTRWRYDFPLILGMIIFTQGGVLDDYARRKLEEEEAKGYPSDEDYDFEDEEIKEPKVRREKSAFSYRLALDNVTDEIVHNNDIPTVAESVLNFPHELTSKTGASQSNVQEGNDCDNVDLIDKNNVEVVSNIDTPKEIAPKQRLQHEIVPTSVALQLNEEEESDGESDAKEILSDSPMSKSHPFATVIPHRCPIITKDLETIQNNSEEERISNPLSGSVTKVFSMKILHWNIRGLKRKASLDVVHKHGPCSQLNKNNNGKANILPTHSDVLKLDKERVNYSARSCYTQQDEIFDPSKSTSYCNNHICAKFHAGSRAICGGPVYLSDNVGSHAFNLIKKLFSLMGRRRLKIKEALEGVIEREILFPSSKTSYIEENTKTGEERRHFSNECTLKCICSFKKRLGPKRLLEKRLAHGTLSLMSSGAWKNRIALCDFFAPRKPILLPKVKWKLSL